VRKCGELGFALVCSPRRAAILGRLKDRERSAALSHMALRSAEVHAVTELESEAAKIVSFSRPKTVLRGHLRLLEKRGKTCWHTFSPSLQFKAVGKIRNYMFKWKALRHALPGVATELEVIGLERGPEIRQSPRGFLSGATLGKARKRKTCKILRKLAGIKEPRKK